jgi:hypothetical protein
MTSLPQSAILTGVVGAALSLATGNALGVALDVRQAYLLTAGSGSLCRLRRAAVLAGRAGAQL